MHQPNKKAERSIFDVIVPPNFSLIASNVRADVTISLAADGGLLVNGERFELIAKLEDYG